MPVEVKNARFVAVDAVVHGLRPRMYGLMVSGGGLVAWPVVGRYLALPLVALGIVLFAVLYKREASARLHISVNRDGVWFRGLPEGLRIPFAAVACASCETREVNTGHGNHEITVLVVDLKPGVAAQLMPGVGLKPSYEIVCARYDVAPDDIARCIDGYVKELGDKDFKLRAAMEQTR